MFDALSDLFDRDGKQRHGRATGLRGLLQRFTGGNHDDDRRSDRGRYRGDDDDEVEYDADRRSASRHRRSRHDDADDDD